MMSLSFRQFIFGLAAFLVFFSFQASAQITGSGTLLNPYVVDSFPNTYSNLNTGTGETATGMQGACPALPCCSTAVFKVTLPTDGVLRVEMANFTPLAGSIIAYYNTDTTGDPSSFSDLQYVAATVGNFCGFRDTLQLGRGFQGWDNTPFGQQPITGPFTALYDFNAPSTQAGFMPAGDYWILVFNENQQASLGVGSNVDLSFEFVPGCEPLTAPTSLVFDTLEVNAQAETLSVYLKNDRQLDVDIDVLNGINITGANAADFSIVTLPDSNLAVGDSTLVQIQFAPTSGGTRSAEIEFNFSDSTCSNSSSITLSGTGGESQLSVIGNNISISQNDTFPSSNDGTDFGSTVFNAGSISKTFYIVNSGSDTLDLTGNPIINLVGSSQFVLSGTPASTLLPGDSTSFSVVFTPTSAGFDTADIFIVNSSAQSNFQFRIKGLGSGLNGLDFDGSGDYVIIDDVAADMAGVTAFTVESWVKVDPAQSGNDMLFAVNTSSNGSRMFIKMDDGVWEFDIGTSSDQMNGPDIRDDQWHHVAFTFDNGAMNYYLDGVLTDSETNNTPSFASTDKWSIGQEWDNGGASDFFNGAVDDLRLWKTVRTASQLAGERFCEASTPNGDLVAYYTFNQGLPAIDNSSFTQLFDNSGNGHDGDLNGFALNGTSSNFTTGSGVGAGCTSFSVSVCDAATYTAPSGAVFDSTGVYNDTVSTANGDSALVINLSINFSEVTQSVMQDTSVCDTLKVAAQTELTTYARFENSNDDWVEINGSIDSLINTNRSIFLWMREADQISGSSDILVGINTSGTGTVTNFGIGTNEQITIYDGGTTRNSGVVVTDGQWHFVGYTYDEASNLTQFWVDGVAASSFSNGQSISSTSRMSIGQEFDGSAPGNFYDGDLTEVSIWNEVLDSAEIAMIMAASIDTSHPKYNKLKAYYPMKSDCGSDGFTLKDFGSHGYDGVASSATIVRKDSLVAIPSFNAAGHYDKDWSLAGNSLSTNDELNVTGTVQAGTYQLKLQQDFFEVQDTFSVSVQAQCSGPIAAINSVSNLSCNGLNNGGATASATGGTTPYTYAWSNSATTASITALSAGTYSVTITDANGSTDSSSVAITEPAALIAASVVDSNISCNGSFDGGVTASATGGTTPYTYAWSNGATTASMTGIGAGTYSVTITDQNGCTDSTSIGITEPAVLIASAVLDSNDAGNGGGATGSATGGTMAYTYAWSNGATAASITGAAAGTYSITITDANGCTDSASVLITSGPSLNVVLDSNVSCNGLLNGGATASISGGTTPYTYAWSNSASTASITGVGPGTYVVTITDANSLVEVDSVTITEPIALSIDSISIVNVNCFGEANGSAFANVNGGTSAYSYAWSNSGTSAAISSLSGATYSVTVTDANGCTDSSSTIVIEPDSISLTVTSGTDSIDLTLSGGTTPYTFLWSNGATTEDLNNLSSGTYTVTITDANSCNKIFMQEVVNPAEFFITTWKTDNPGGTNSTSVLIPAFNSSYSYNYDVDWDGDGVFDEFGLTASATHDYGTAGTYTVQIKGQFPSLYFNPNGPSDDQHKLLSVDQWGAIAWETMEFAFYDCDSFNIIATDTPNFSAVTSMEHMFDRAGMMNSDIGYWDVSTITDMSYMFYEADSFDQDISSWNVSNVIDMSNMFNRAEVFNQDIDSWDVSNVTDMESMFTYAEHFNQGLNSWDVSSVTSMRSMFSSAYAFNSPIGSWDVDSVVDMSRAFQQALVFNQDISGWDVSSVEDMQRMFAFTDSFDVNIGNWDVSSVTNMQSVFEEAESFNQDIGTWNTGTATTMKSMFDDAVSFNQDIGAWDVSSVTDMSRMFDGAEIFNQDIGAWDVDTVTTMNRMFAGADAFHQDLNSWEVSAVTDMSNMFNGADLFNGDISGWDVSAVQTMSAMFILTDSFNIDLSTWNVSSVSGMDFMFYRAESFNQDIGSWDVSSVTNMSGMFRQAADFDQNLAAWDVDSVTNMTDMFRDAELSIENYDSLLIGWATQPLQSNIAFHGGDSKYCAGEAARQSMITNFTWTFTDDGKSCPPTVSIVSTNVSCNGIANGTASASAVNGQSPYTFLWSTGATTDSISGLSSGTYVVTVTDNVGETETASVTITEPAALISASVVDANISCNGFSDGGATASASGGTMPYTYSWNNGATNASITGVVASTYSVTITDQNGCTDSTSVGITEPTVLIASTVLDSNDLGNGGGATGTATGGTSPYTYAWNNGATNATISGVAATTYSITITDQNGCTDSASVLITAGPLASVTVNSNVSCNGLTDGGATASSSAGTAPFTYAWSNSATTASITGVVAGTYSVTITDSNGLTDSTSIIITEPALLISATVVDSNVTCNSFTDGGATASATGGTMPYTYSWSNAATTASITGVMAGTYSVTITDANGCTDSTTAQVAEPDSVSFNFLSVIDAGCNGASDGGFIYNITGGTPDISGTDTNYNVISTFGPGVALIRDTVIGFGAGPFFVVASDDNGCLSDTAGITINEPVAVQVSINLDSNASCNGFSDGGATATGSNGVGAYTYMWSNADTTASIAGLSAGTYTVTATDANGCTATSSVTITEPVVLAASVTIDSNENCVGSIDGQATGSATGGTMPYTYAWSNGSTMVTATGLTAGTYTITITDANGCTAVATDTVIVSDVIAPTVITQNITVYLDSNGAVSITANDVDNGSTDNCAIDSLSIDVSSFSCSDTGANTVILTVNDLSGNSDTASAIVTVMDTIAPAMITQNVTIYLDANGMASITTANIDNGSLDACGIASLALDSMMFDCGETGANTVTLTATDVNGNVNTATAMVTVLDTIAPVAMSQNVTIYLDANGAASITTSDIDNSSSDNCSIAMLALDSTSFDCGEVGANTVVLTVTDPSGNTDTASAVVTVMDTIVPTVVTQNIMVYLDANGAASIIPADINNASFDNCSIATYSLDSTDFDCGEVGDNIVVLTITDVNGNVNSATAIVTVSDTISPTAITQNVTIYLDANGDASITTADIDNNSFDNCGIATLSLDSTNFDCGEVGANTVTLTVTDVNANTNTATATVTVLDTILPTVITQNITLYLDSNGEASTDETAINNGSFDNCGITTISLDSSNFDCGETGANTVTLIITDDNGNVNTGTATVTVLDTIAPALMVDVDTAVCATDASGTMVEFTNTASDNCGANAIVQTAGLASGSIFPVGITRNVFEVSDASGNVTTDSFTVEVYAFPVLAIDAVDLLCETADAVNLNAVPTGGVFTGNGVSGSMFDPTAVVAGNTEITYTYTTPESCVYSASVFATVRENPVVTLGAFPDTICVELEVVANPVATPAGGIYSGNGVDSILFYTQDAGIGEHWVSYFYEDEYGCSNVDSTLANVVRCIDPFGVEETEAAMAPKVFPNPNRGTFTIQHSYTTEVSLSIYNMDGSLVRQISALTSTQEITLEQKTQGIYFLQITGEGVNETMRIIVQ